MNVVYVGELENVNTKRGETQRLNFSIAYETDAITEAERNQKYKPSIYINVTAWSNRAQFLSQALKVGGRIFVSGKLHFRLVTKDDGTPSPQHSLTRIVELRVIDYNENYRQGQQTQTSQGFNTNQRQQSSPNQSPYNFGDNQRQQYSNQQQSPNQAQGQVDSGTVNIEDEELPF